MARLTYRYFQNSYTSLKKSHNTFHSNIQPKPSLSLNQITYYHASYITLHNMLLISIPILSCFYTSPNNLVWFIEVLYDSAKSQHVQCSCNDMGPYTIVNTSYMLRLYVIIKVPSPQTQFIHITSCLHI